MFDIPTSRRLALMQAIKRLPNILAYYPLNEVDGAIARNYARGALGTLDGAISGPSLNQPGKIGRAYLFDGTNDQITSSLWSNAITTVSMGVFYKSTDFTVNGQTIISNGVGVNPTGRGYSLVLSGNATTDGSLMILDHNVKWVDTTYNIQDNNWHFILLVLKANGNPVVYVDGISRFDPGSNTFAAPTGGSLIGEGGAAPGFPRWAKGIIQNAFIARTVMSNEQQLKIARIAGFI